MVVEATSRSGATTVVTVRGYHVVKIDGYSRTLNSHGARPDFSSSPFRAAGYAWHLCYRPMGSWYRPDNTEFVSLYLVLDDVVDEAVVAEASFSLLKQDGTSAKTVTTDPNNFSLSPVVGYERFVEREELKRSEYLKDDCFSIRVRVHKVKQPTSYVTVPPSDLHRHLGDLLSSKEDADVEFQVGGETFVAHQVVLAARSPVFMAKLFGPMKVATNVVIQIHDMEPKVFDALLKFIYTDAWPELEDDYQFATTQHLLVAADKYLLQRLKLMCEDRLCYSYINNTNSAVTILALAEQHCCPRLKDACYEFLASSTAVIESQDLEFLAQSCPTVVEELAYILEKTKM